jgi:hypothetical protein
MIKARGEIVLGGRDERIPEKYPLRNIRQVENDALATQVHQQNR